MRVPFATREPTGSAPISSERGLNSNDNSQSVDTNQIASSGILAVAFMQKDGTTIREVPFQRVSVTNQARYYAD